MMRSLTFALPQRVRGRLVRAAVFEQRSLLPVSAACVVAAAVQQTLSNLLGMSVVTRVFEPAIPSPRAWDAISAGASIYRVRGSLSDAAIVLRPGDALALAGAALGEFPPDRRRAPSPIERDLLERCVSALAGSLAAVCGRTDAGFERIESLGGFTTYFELTIDGPFEARIGIALSRDQEPEPRGQLCIDDLGDAQVDARAVIELGRLDAGAVARLALGAMLPITGTSMAHGSLRLGGRQLARGNCGVRGGRYAFCVERVERGA
jgi:hypothetical protein